MLALNELYGIRPFERTALLFAVAFAGIVIVVVIDLSVQVKRDEHTVGCEIAVYLA